ncbi:MAG: EAL domain-containing protein [Snowella sp.]|nr:EAL domain-containing protein [Snowella sp.]
MAFSKADIVVIDDTPENLTLLARILTERGYKVRSAAKSSHGLRAIQTIPPDLILLDIFMPELNGYEVCRQLKANPKTQEIPIIFISALGDVIDKVTAFSVGGVDYITKPFQVEEVIARVENQLQLQVARAEIRQLNLVLEERVKERTHELEKAQERLHYLALHDSLTNLPNRALFLQKLQDAITRATVDPDFAFAVLFLDGDRFKVVNDSLGHLMGDELLIAVGQRLLSSLREGVTLARIGGDEFTILVEGIQDTEEVIQLAESIHQAMSYPFSLNNNPIFINFSIGICLNRGYSQPEQILRDADIAMYKAKARGKGCYQLFDATMHKNAVALLQLESELRQSLIQSAFTVYYQPIIHLESEKLVGFEALVRWIHPTLGIISPLDFIPLAEDTGLIIPLGLWVLETACLQLTQWQQAQLIDAQVTMSINLSPKQFAQPHLLEKIDEIIERLAISAHCLKLEITESAIIENIDSATQILNQLRDRCIQISIDDFGTGYSSLNYLHRFPINTLKIDRSFVNQIEGDGERKAIVKTIIELAHILKMDVIAEGIETRTQQQLLAELNCEFGQGFLFSKPLPQADITQWLTATQ